jgi:hypothetical protein
MFRLCRNRLCHNDRFIAMAIATAFDPLEFPRNLIAVAPLAPCEICPDQLLAA